jgi:CheY-like chemotaxis protein
VILPSVERDGNVGVVVYRIFDLIIDDMAPVLQYSITCGTRILFEEFMTASPCILVADDKPAVREALRILLVNQGYSVELATSPRDVLRLIREREFALALLDLNYARDTTSGEEGLELVQQLQKIEGTPPLVVMTAWATVDLAVAAMRNGARDFIQKPWLEFWRSSKRS